MVEAQFLASLPLKAEEKIQAKYIWVYLVLRHIAILFFPTHQVIRKPNVAMCISLGIRTWCLPTMHWKLRYERGGYALGSARNFLLWCHSLAYVRTLRATSEMGAARKAPKLQFDTVYFKSFLWFR